MASARPAGALLTQVIDAHGGMARWNEREKLEATIVSGGGFFPLKGVMPDPEPRRDGTVVAERRDPKDSFAGHQMSTQWDALHLAYFNGEALWTYFMTPFLLTLEGVVAEEAEPWHEGDETWRVLRAHFPGSIDTHRLVQDFFFDHDFRLRRHDYSVNIAGGFPASQLTSDYIMVDGIHLATKRRAYTRGPDRRPILDMLMVRIDISDVHFT